MNSADVFALVPNPDDLLKLRVEERGKLILTLLTRQGNSNELIGPTGAGRVNHRNFFNRANDFAAPPKYGSRQKEVDEALMEAWDRLAGQGSLARDPAPGPDWFFVTTAGKNLLKQNDTEASGKSLLQLAETPDASMMTPSQANAWVLLKAIHEKTRSGTRPIDDVSRLITELTEEEARAAFRYLKDKGLIQTFSLPYAARINADGIDAIETKDFPSARQKQATAQTETEPVLPRLSPTSPTEAQHPSVKQARIARIEKTVFISYRRIAAPWAQSIFQDLTHNGYDVFFDFHGIASGGFEEVIFENIKARAHFLVLLTPSALERCSDPADLFRREIETAVRSQRNIVPIMLEGFDFNAAGIDRQLGETLTALKQYNGLPVYAAYFPEAMSRLREKYLNVPLDTVLHPVSLSAEQVSKEEQVAAANAPSITEQELKEAGLPRYLFTVKLNYQDELEKPEGTRADEPYGPGSLIIYDGESVIARYNNVERWSRQRQP
jgi:TIR domain